MRHFSNRDRSYGRPNAGYCDRFAGRGTSGRGRGWRQGRGRDDSERICGAGWILELAAYELNSPPSRPLVVPGDVCEQSGLGGKQAASRFENPGGR